MGLELAMSSLVIGGVMGLLILMAAAAADRQPKLWLFLAGIGWGVLATALLLTDCYYQRGPGPVSNTAFPVFFAGVFAWPAYLAWRQRLWPLRWVLAQLVMLLTLLPAFGVAVAAAMCALD